MSTQEWVTIISVVAAAAVNLGVIGKWLRLHRKALIGAMSGIISGAKVVEKGVATATEDFAKFPGVAAVKTVLGTELHSVEDLLRKSQILQVAGSALHGFEANLISLTDNQKGSVVQFVGSELKRLGIDITVPEIMTALSDVQRVSDQFKNTQVYKNTVALDQSIAALKETAAAVPVA